MKDYRKKELRNYVIGNIISILFFSGVFDTILKDGSITCMNWVHLLIESALFSSILYIYTYIVDSMIPALIKEKISLWPFKKPGHVVFEYIRFQKKLYKDDRFTVGEVQEKYKQIYKTIDEKNNKIKKLKNKKKKRKIKKELERYQNSKWFDISRQQSSDDAVFTAHKDYLLNRDMNMITISIFVFYFVIYFSTDLLEFSYKEIILLLAEFIATGFAAKFKSIRFVLTVISRDIHKI